MNAKFLRQHRGGGARLGRAADDVIEGQGWPIVSRACCCPARPVVRVVMPPTATRPHSVDLLLCGHHYRVSCQALAAAGAAVSVLPEIADNKSVALLPEVPRARVPARPPAD